MYFANNYFNERLFGPKWARPKGKFGNLRSLSPKLFEEQAAKSARGRYRGGMQLLKKEAFGRGILVGTGILIPLAALVLILERAGVDSDAIGVWAFLVAIIAFAAAGFVSAKESKGAPFSNGLVAGAGSFVLWSLLYACIWVVRKAIGTSTGEHSGGEVALSFLAYLIVAGACGLLGAAIGAKMRARDSKTAGRPRADLDPTEERPDSIEQGAG